MIQNVHMAPKVGSCQAIATPCLAGWTALVIDSMELKAAAPSFRPDIARWQTAIPNVIFVLTWAVTSQTIGQKSIMHAARGRSSTATGLTALGMTNPPGTTALAGTTIPALAVTFAEFDPRSWAAAGSHPGRLFLAKSAASSDGFPLSALLSWASSSACILFSKRC